MGDIGDLIGLVPESLAPVTRKISFRGYALPVDIGFHDFEIGSPQRVLVDLDIWVDARSFPDDDDARAAWNYDVLHRNIADLTRSRRFNLQETLAREIYDLIAARQGVTALRVATRKPDIYPDCAGVGVELSSF